MTTDGYYRYPTIHKNQVAFVAEDDLWLVPVRGGVARRLTASLSLVSHPAFSPDGRWLAFVGREDGETEVYLMPAEGGPARRLTYLGNSTTVLGWTPDSQRIVFASNVSQPFKQLTPIYTISREGGQPELLPYGPAHSLAFGPGGQILLGRRTQELATWKRYRGGRAGEIWIDAQGNGDFKPLLNLNSNLTHPMWLGERIFFLSDHEGIGNIYSCTPQGEDIQRHTHHEDYYTRQPRTDGERIVYRAGADLYSLDPKGRGSQKIKIKFHSPQAQRHRKFVKAGNYLESYSIHPGGHSLTITTRGKLFSLSNWEGPVFQYGESHGIRYRLAEWLNDGKRLVLVSDAGGEDALEIHMDAAYSPTERPVERLEGLDIGRPFFLQVSPRRDEVILGNHRHELLHVDLETKSLRVLDKSLYGRIAGADWSPDGRWVVYGLKDSRHTCAIKLCQVESGETHYVTPPRNLQDLNPTFDPGGRHIYFISYREFDPVYDSHYFDLNFPRGSRPYLVTLQQELPNPFIPRPPEIGPPPENGNKKEEPAKEPEGGEKAEEEKKEGETAEAPAEKPPERPEEWTLKIDLEDIQNRVLAFPVPEGRYYQVEGIKGKVYFTSYPVEGSLNHTWHDSDNENKGTLEYYDLAERRKEFVVNGVGSFEFSRNRNFLIYRSGKHLRVLKAGEKPDNNATGYNKKSGWINLERLNLAISPPEEWQQMFREAWRLQRDHFWTEDMSRIDWQVVYKRYYKLIDRVSSRAEFSDLLWEMQGELGTSHAYELGGDYRTAPRYFQGELGADFVYDPEVEGYRITHIVRGDPWQERFNSPLNDVGVNAKVGDVLLAIDGQRLSQTRSPGELLVNRTNSEVQLTFISPNGASPENSEEGKPEPWTALVKTLADDGPARYREWVERNRRQVHEATGGRIGYVHIPDMGPFGYAEFHRYYLSESEREGLIIDVRFNGGGHVSQLLLEKLARRRLGYKKPRYGEAWPYPSHIVMGPLVALTNEYAGSDGDIFSHAFKLMRLGKLIGKRTWGGVIGIWPRYSLVDGTLTTQPEFSSWFEDVGWAVENYGTEPDIEVDIRPQDYAAGKDPQLERGLKEILKALEESPPVQPDFGTLPSRSLPKLPKIKKN